MDNFYVSPTEFASISGVSRQTLIFFMKKKVSFYLHIKTKKAIDFI